MTGFTKGTDMKEKDTEKQLKALEEAVRQEQETGGNSRADNARDVRTHCVHQKEVCRICLCTDLL